MNLTRLKLMSTYSRTLNRQLPSVGIGFGGRGDGSTDSGDRRLLWLAIIVVGVVFFMVGHNFLVSQYERYAPWSDADGELTAAGQNWVKGLALSVIGLLGACLAIRRDGRPLRAEGWLPVLMIFYLAWSAASVLWSIDAGMSCRRLAVLTFLHCGDVRVRPTVSAPRRGGDGRRDRRILLAVGVCAELALGTFRPWSPEYRFAGTVHPNTQGGQHGRPLPGVVLSGPIRKTGAGVALDAVRDRTDLLCC